MTTEHADFTMKAALDELERLIAQRVVAATPIELGDYTVIPLCSVGFGFGGGRGQGKDAKDGGGSGDGAGLGFGGGVKPVAVVIKGPDGVRVETVKGDMGANIASLAESLSDKFGDKNEA